MVDVAILGSGKKGDAMWHVPHNNLFDSQIINSIITPYMPKKYMIESTFEFIQITKTIRKPKCFVSLDVENLFTNVPVLQTIEIILENVYNNPAKPPPDIPKKILEELLLICSTRT